VEWSHTGEPTDLDGNPRFMNGDTDVDCSSNYAIRADMGCYEDTLPGDDLECGDANNSCTITAGDAFYILNSLGSGPDVCPYLVGDVNLDDSVSAADAQYIFSWFGGGPDPCDPNGRSGGAEYAEVCLGTPATRADTIEIPILGNFGVSLMGYFFKVAYDPRDFAVYDPEVIREVENGMGTMHWHGIAGGQNRRILATSGGTWKEDWTRDTIGAGEDVTLITLRMEYTGEGEPDFDGLEIEYAELVDLDANALVTNVLPGFEMGGGSMSFGSGFRFPFRLLHAKPNPFTQMTEITYSIAGGCVVSLDVFDAAGRRVRALVDEFQGPGMKVVSWDGSDDLGNAVAPGIYFCKMKARDYEACRTLVLMR
jgi:hypothetical protein